MKHASEFTQLEELYHKYQPYNIKFLKWLCAICVGFKLKKCGAFNLLDIPNPSKVKMDLLKQYIHYVNVSVLIKFSQKTSVLP